MAMRILIADDEKVSRRLLEKTLLRAGYEVVAVENGREAAEKLSKADSPRVALLDWIMPELNGPEVCQAVRQQKDKPYRYLVLLSSKESKADIVLGLESGADDYLTKPFDPEELKARVRAGERVLQLEDSLVAARESMRYQATHDHLTSLLNRGVIIELLGRELLRSRRENSSTGIILCDVDDFKLVNDTYGHVTGDEVLKEVARRLLSCVRGYDFVGRYGGEEFVIVMPETDMAVATIVAERLRRRIASEPFAIAQGTKSIEVTISIGLATLDTVDDNTATILKRADQALYRAKRDGRNRVVADAA
jgi:diguanylate cyclase (GGDEF)-like protein